MASPTNPYGLATAAYQTLLSILAATTASFTAAKDSKLAAIAAGATANSADAVLLDRANHTGTQSADTITDGASKKSLTANERLKLNAINPSAPVTTAAALDASGSVAITVANGASVAIAPAGAGYHLLVIAETSFTGSMSIWLLDGAAAFMVFQTSNWQASTIAPGVGFLSVNYNGGQFKVYNAQGNTCTLKPCLVKLA